MPLKLRTVQVPTAGQFHRDFSNYCYNRKASVYKIYFLPCQQDRNEITGLITNRLRLERLVLGLSPMQQSLKHAGRKECDPFDPKQKYYAVPLNFIVK